MHSEFQVQIMITVLCIVMQLILITVKWIKTNYQLTNECFQIHLSCSIMSPALELISRLCFHAVQHQVRRSYGATKSTALILSMELIRSVPDEQTSAAKVMMMAWKSLAMTVLCQSAPFLLKWLVFTRVKSEMDIGYTAASVWMFIVSTRYLTLTFCMQNLLLNSVTVNTVAVC